MSVSDIYTFRGQVYVIVSGVEGQVQVRLKEFAAVLVKRHNGTVDSDFGFILQYHL